MTHPASLSLRPTLNVMFLTFFRPSMLSAVGLHGDYLYNHSVLPSIADSRKSPVVVSCKMSLISNDLALLCTMEEVL